MVNNTIKAELIRNGYSTKTMANELNLHYNTLNNKIIGKQEFTGSELLLMSKLLKVSIDYLLNNKNLENGNSQGFGQ